VRGRAQAKKSTLRNAASYLRCVARRYTQFRGPTLLNNRGNYSGYSYCCSAKNEVSYDDILVGGQ